MFDGLTLVGLVVGLDAIREGGNVLEGGPIGAPGQLAALIIVVGGAVGVAMVQPPLRSSLVALCMGAWIAGVPVGWRRAADRGRRR